MEVVAGNSGEIKHRTNSNTRENSFLTNESMPWTLMLQSTTEGEKVKELGVNTTLLKLM